MKAKLIEKRLDELNNGKITFNNYCEITGYYLDCKNKKQIEKLFKREFPDSIPEEEK